MGHHMPPRTTQQTHAACVVSGCDRNTSMQHQNGNPRSLYLGPNRQHTDPHQGSMPSTALRSDQEKCLLLTSPFIEPGPQSISYRTEMGPHCSSLNTVWKLLQLPHRT